MFINLFFGIAVNWTAVSLYMVIKEIDCASASSNAKNIASGIQTNYRWTLEGNERLQAVVAKYPPEIKGSWEKVAKEMGDGRWAE